MGRDQQKQLTLEPIDFVLAVKVCLGPGQKWTYRHLADELCLAVSNAHKSAKRACAAKLLSNSAESELTANSVGLREFTLHGVVYAFPATTGSLTRGVPTAHAGPILKDILSPSNEPPPVWPSRDGEVRGYALLRIPQPSRCLAHRECTSTSNRNGASVTDIAVNPDDKNVPMLEEVARALGPLSAQAVFLGGCAVGLLIVDEGRPPVRVTEDVDLAIDTKTLAEYHALGAQLREKGFREDTESASRRIAGTRMPCDTRRPVGFPAAFRSTS
jgi:hypothetical protein